MGTKRPRQRYQDILDACATIARYIEGCTKEDWDRDSMRRDAVERQLLLLAEAAVKLDEVAKVDIPDQPWEQMRGLGNRLRHEYDKIDSDLIWNLVSEDLLSKLAQDVERHLARTDAPPA